MYDKQYITPSSDQSEHAQPPLSPIPPHFTIERPPDNLQDSSNLQAWQNLFMARRAWAIGVAEKCAPVKEPTRSQTRQAEIIGRAVDVAMENLRSHVNTMEHKSGDTRVWAKESLKGQQETLKDWQRALETLERIPAREDFSFLLQRPSTPTSHSTSTDASDTKGTLAHFVDGEGVRRAASQGSTSSRKFSRHFSEVEKAVHEVASDASNLAQHITSTHAPLNEEDLDALFEDIETFAKKISSDYEHVLSMQNNPKSISNISRIALVHTKEFLPTLQATAEEINKISQQAAEIRNKALTDGIEHLQNISIIESGLSGIQSKLSKLDLEVEGEDAFQLLDTVHHLPSTYGLVLVEAVRRREWNAKVKSDSASLAEEMATYEEEEQRRRKKWTRTIGDFLQEDQDTKTLGVEINLQGESSEWPQVSRQELEDYLDHLEACGLNDVIQDLEQPIKDLDAPTKHQKRRAKAFKNGSVYDAGLGIGRSSLLLQGDDGMLRELRDQKVKLEDKLKGSESRIRKLEDLLHRQSQIGRPLSANFGPPSSELNPLSPTGPLSPRPQDTLSRRSSVSSRRLSSNQNPEEKVLIQRIVTLEADLVSERDTTTRLRKEAHAERRSSTEIRDKMVEAESTKNDLLANLEAQQLEFEDERRHLEDDIHQLKIKLEEIEEELDRVQGSQEHAQLTADQRIRQLETELDNQHKHHADELAKAQGQTDYVRNDYLHHRERASALEKQVQQHKDEKSSLQERNLTLANKLRGFEDKEADNLNSLQAAYSQLSPEGSAPEDFGRLVHAIEVLSEGLAIHARGSDEEAALAAAENKALEEKISNMDGEIEQLKDKFGNEEIESFSLREALAQEQNKLSNLESAHANTQTELEHLRSKFAAGETGSEALKDRVADEERRVGELSEKVAVAEGKASSLEQELATWKGKVRALSDTEQQVKARLDERGGRAKDLSQRLLSHHDRIIRILEQIGYTITRQEDNVVIQRASRTGSSTILGDASTTLKRSQSSNSPTRRYTATHDLDLMYWMQASDSEAETSRYSAFTSSLATLDLDAAADTIVKRVKDVETLARKWQKDSRAYRDRYHRAQTEAHDKIAYRGFKEGDLALFLPTRNQATRPWAAFNVGAPHYFLREQDSHKLQTRDWLLARITRAEERIVDLSKSMNGGYSNNNQTPDRQSLEANDGTSIDENPFELSDGLRWYMLDAAEEKPGAPSTPGLGKSTVASTMVDVKGSINRGPPTTTMKKSASNSAATKTLSKSLDSRRSSSNSKKGVQAIIAPAAAASNPEATVSEEAVKEQPNASSVVVQRSTDDVEREAREDAPLFDEVRRDLLWGP